MKLNSINKRHIVDSIFVTVFGTIAIINAINGLYGYALYQIPFLCIFGTLSITEDKRDLLMDIVKDQNKLINEIMTIIEQNANT